MAALKNPKPCKICNIVGHSASFCYWRKRKPMKRSKQPTVRKTSINRLGKHGKKWLAFRTQWFIDNPADFYICYICGDRLTRRETTLDHVNSRSGNPELRYDNSNLRPCCYLCNTDKGSLSYERYEKKKNNRIRIPYN